MQFAMQTDHEGYLRLMFGIVRVLSFELLDCSIPPPFTPSSAAAAAGPGQETSETNVARRPICQQVACAAAHASH
jgi:hypothetical protein